MPDTPPHPARFSEEHRCDVCGAPATVRETTVLDMEAGVNLPSDLWLCEEHRTQPNSDALAAFDRAIEEARDA